MAERRFGVLIANSEFAEEEGLPTLTRPEYDVDGLKEVLTAPPCGLFSPEDLAVLKNGTNQVVLERVEEILSQAAKDDLVLIYYSGHGVRGGGIGDQRLNLATRNTRRKLLGSTSIPVPALRDLIDAGASSKVVLILDCCFSGLAGKAFVKSAVEEQLRDVSSGRGTYILTASTRLQQAIERPQDRFSLLTKHIIDGIRDERADRDGDGLITMDELYSYVHDNVLAEGAHEPEKYALNVRGDLIIARTGRQPRLERRKHCRELLTDLWKQNYLPTRIFSKALPILEMKPGEVAAGHADFDRLLDQLAMGEITVADFIERWPEPRVPGNLSNSVMAPVDVGQARPAAEVPLYRLYREIRIGDLGVTCKFGAPWNGLASISGDGVPVLLDAWTGDVLRRFEGLEEPCCALALRPDGGTLAAGGSAGGIALWDLKSGALVQRRKGRGSHVSALEFHPGGNFLALANYDGNAEIWDTAKDVAIANWQGDLIHVFVFGRDSVLAGDRLGWIRVRPVGSSSPAREWQAHAGAIYFLRFSPDGMLLASGGRDSRIKLWESRDWSAKATLRRHRFSIFSAAFSPDGNVLATAGADGTVKLSNVSNGEMLADIRCGDGGVESVDFNADGSLLAASSAAGTIRVWERARQGYEPRFLAQPQQPIEVSPAAVSLQYDFDAGGGVEKQKVPFVIGVLGNFSGMLEKVRLRERRFVDINKENFDDVMSVIGPRLHLQVDYVLDIDKKIGAEFKFSRMADFEPDSIARQVPVLRDSIGSWVGRQIDLILHDPAFQALEASWRGLEYLVSRVGASSKVRVRLLDAGKNEVLRDLQRAAEFDQSALFKKVYEEEFGQMGGEPFALLLGDYSFGRHPEYVELLEKISNVSAASHCIFLGAATPDLFNLIHFGELAGQRDMGEIFKTSPYKRWRSFLESDDSRYVGLVLPRILLRPPRPGETGPDGGPCPLLWGNPAYAVAAQFVEFHQRYGWLSPPRGESVPRRAGGLPVIEARTDDDDPAPACPTEIALTARRCEELASLGFIPLQYVPGGGQVEIPVLASCNQHDNERLDWRMALSRIDQTLSAIVRLKWRQLASREELHAFVDNWIQSHFEPGASFSVQTKEIPGKPGHYRTLLKPGKEIRFR